MNILNRQNFSAACSEVKDKQIVNALIYGNKYNLFDPINLHGHIMNPSSSDKVQNHVKILSDN